MDLNTQTDNENYIINKFLFDQLTVNYLKNKLHNSIILYGNKGIGKSTFVYKLVENIFNQIDNSLSNYKNIDHEIKISNFTPNSNFYILKKEYDLKKNKYKSEITIDQIKKLDKFIYLTKINKYPKIILIDSADDLNKSSSNALLKILEEPKKDTYFFLISHHLSKLLITIRSRCIKYKFNNLDYDNFKKIINLKYNFDSENEIKNLFLLCDGSPGLVFKYYDYDINNLYNTIVNLCLKDDFFDKSFLDFITKVSQNEDYFLLFLYLFKFILLNTVKIYIGINNKNLEALENISKKSSYKKIMKVFDYLKENEKNVTTFNLDRKTFIINIFSQLKIN